MECFSIYDVKAKIYSAPFLQVNMAVAIRSFTELANDQQTKIAQWPLDYYLYHLGSFDDEEGRYENLEHPLELGRADQFQTKEIPPLGLEPMIPRPNGPIQPAGMGEGFTAENKVS